MRPVPSHLSYLILSYLIKCAGIAARISSKERGYANYSKSEEDFANANCRDLSRTVVENYSDAVQEVDVDVRWGGRGGALLTRPDY
jgi:hypothetical protein